jgi:L-ribulose-5-phosphate 4-epimerase
MLLQELRTAVLDANRQLVQAGLVLYTFGNVSGIDRKEGLIAIKPSGVSYEEMQASDIVITGLDGKIVDGELKPSSDLDTHLELYKHFSQIGAVVHTHSAFATAWAQAERPIPALGTTHADYFFGPVPVTVRLTDEEIKGDYVRHTGLAICRRFEGLDPEAMPAVLVAGHAPFCWGRTPAKAVHTAAVLEYVAQMAFHTTLLNPDVSGVSQALLNQHYFRKHGPTATYGQK